MSSPESAGLCSTQSLRHQVVGSITIWNGMLPHVLPLGKKREKHTPSLKYFCLEVTSVPTSTSCLVPASSKESGKCGFPRVQEGQESPALGAPAQSATAPQHMTPPPESYAQEILINLKVPLRTFFFLSFFLSNETKHLPSSCSHGTHPPLTLEYSSA